MIFCAVGGSGRGRRFQYSGGQGASCRRCAPMASMTSSAGMWLVTPAGRQIGGADGVDRADDVALHAGHLHQPATGSQTRPNRLPRAMAKAVAHWSPLPPGDA